MANEITGCGCAGGQEFAKVSKPEMKKPAVGHKQGKAPKPKIKDGKKDFAK